MTQAVLPDSETTKAERIKNAADMGGTLLSLITTTSEKYGEIATWIASHQGHTQLAVVQAKAEEIQNKLNRIVCILDQFNFEFEYIEMELKHAKVGVNGRFRVVHNLPDDNDKLFDMSVYVLPDEARYYIAMDEGIV
ncbi:MAG: hypothetical protein JW384_02796 [Nitrosomonadaceae bacterium]|nr:hypothetical protein [Nitrosomonadaceae bacterium]